MYVIFNKNLSIHKKEELDKKTIAAWRNKEVKVIWFPTNDSDKEPLELKDILSSGIKQFGFIHE